MGLHDYYLTSIHNDNEFEFILSRFLETVGEIGFLWIGFYSDDPSFGEGNDAWSWVDGSQVNGSSWDHGVPWKRGSPDRSVNIFKFIYGGKTCIKHTVTHYTYMTTVFYMLSYFIYVLFS